MRRLIARASAVVAAGAVAGALGVSAAGAAAQAPHPARTSSLAAARQMAVPGAKLWVQRYNGPGNDFDGAAAVSVARDGTKVFVTGTSFWNGDAASGMATVAYRASDGAQLWVARLNGPAGNTGARAIVSPGGNRVFVTGEVQSKQITAEYGTVAYNATTGARLWARRYAGQGATSIAVSPDLAKVYVTGESHGDYGTLAYSARTGARLWARFYGGRRSFEFANSVAVSPGGTVLVTGGSRGPAGLNTDYATVAYSPGGHQLWVRRYSGPGDHSDIAYAVAVPGSGRVYVTGTSWGGSVTGDDYATIAYNVRPHARAATATHRAPGGSPGA